MTHPNVDLVQKLYAAFMSGDTQKISASLSPHIAWHNSGRVPGVEDAHGVEAVLGFLFADNHMDDYALEVIDVLASDARAAVIARASGRRGDRRLTNDFVQVLEIHDGQVVEVWNYYWDQQAVAEFMAVPL